MTTSATTRLEAVNILLSVIGESPVNSLDDDTIADVAMAQALLDETDKEVQMQGWHWNSECEIELQPDASDNINIPANYVRVDVRRSNASGDELTVRGSLLYNLTDHTFTFTTAVKVDAVLLLPFADIPEHARHYIIVRAARKFQDRMIGSTEHHRYNREDEVLALARLQEHEAETGDHTVFDNLDTFSTISRYRDRSFGLWR